MAELNAEIYKGLIVGVGQGTFAVIICIILAVICCFFKNSVIFPNLCVFCAILFPALVFLIIYTMPKESLASDTTQEDLLPTSWYFLKTMTFLILITIVFIIAMCSLCCLNCKKVSIRRIDSEVGANQPVTGGGLEAKGYDDESDGEKKEDDQEPVAQSSPVQAVNNSHLNNSNAQSDRRSPNRSPNQSINNEGGDIESWSHY